MVEKKPAPFSLYRRSGNADFAPIPHAFSRSDDFNASLYLVHFEIERSEHVDADRFADAMEYRPELAGLFRNDAGVFIRNSRLGDQFGHSPLFPSFFYEIFFCDR